jgi:hypothetical protein
LGIHRNSQRREQQGGEEGEGGFHGVMASTIIRWPPFGSVAMGIKVGEFTGCCVGAALRLPGGSL